MTTYVKIKKNREKCSNEKKNHCINNVNYECSI